MKTSLRKYKVYIILIYFYINDNFIEFFLYLAIMTDTEQFFETFYQSKEGNILFDFSCDHISWFDYFSEFFGVRLCHFYFIVLNGFLLGVH